MYKKECYAISFFIVDANGDIVGNGIAGPLDSRTKVDEVLTRRDYIPSGPASKMRLYYAFKRIGDYLDNKASIYERSIGGGKTEYALSW